MSEYLEYFLLSDRHFYQDYAIPLIKNNPRVFDLDGFDSLLSENKSIKCERTIKEAYHGFLLDQKAQYEMHPKFGRYVSCCFLSRFLLFNLITFFFFFFFLE